METSHRILGLSREPRITWHTWRRKAEPQRKIPTEEELLGVQKEVMSHLEDVRGENVLFKQEGMTRGKYLNHRRPQEPRGN